MLGRTMTGNGDGPVFSWKPTLVRPPSDGPLPDGAVLITDLGESNTKAALGAGRKNLRPPDPLASEPFSAAWRRGLFSALSQGLGSARRARIFCARPEASDHVARHRLVQRARSATV